MAFALLFSTSSFAHARNVQLASDYSAEVQRIVTAPMNDATMDNSAMATMVSERDCCQDDEKSPCKDDGHCTMTCVTFGHSYAILAVVGQLSSAHSLVPSTVLQTYKDGVFPALNAPPPRG